MKILIDKNFGPPPPSQPCLMASFSQAVSWKSKFCSQHFLALSSHFQKGIKLPPAMPKNPGRCETHFFRSGPNPEGPRVRVTGPKITCKGLGPPWKFCSEIRNLLWGDTDTYSRPTHTRTHRHTFSYHICTSWWCKFILHIWMGVMANYEPCKISTISLC